MGFFKDFKDDLSEAVNDLNAESGEGLDKDEDVMVNTLDDPELAQMAANLQKEAEEEQAESNESMNSDDSEETVALENKNEEDLTIKEGVEKMEEKEDDLPVADETAVITAGLKVKGDLSSIGSIDIFGAVDGNVECRGKLTISGELNGNANASEIFINSAHMAGDIVAKGSAKIGQGTVIVGNVFAESAVIAGAIKGDIDVHGPVIIDSTAIIVGDIKSKTVQINNGARIDGRCSQCYAEIDTDSIFDFAK